MGDRLHTAADAPRAEDQKVSMPEIFWYFLELGWLAFGGPIGQIGLMHLELVERRRWIGEDEFVRALNFCHLLPDRRRRSSASLHSRSSRSGNGGSTSSRWSSRAVCSGRCARSRPRCSVARGRDRGARETS